MKKLFHPYHIVDIRPWPLTRSLGAFLITRGLVKMFNFGGYDLLFLGIRVLLLSRVQWWRDVSREATYQGLHSVKVLRGIEIGIILFIVSEIMFFFSFFWAFFHSRLSPTPELGRIWPPVGLTPIDPFTVPLLNTIILLSSGVTVTVTHRALLEGDHVESLVRLFQTIVLGFYFIRIQRIEYDLSGFRIRDSVYGSVFFVTTGFHGLHVIIGTLFLTVCFFRLLRGHFRDNHHFGFEARAWYWHFVDVVWLFLFCFVYWWGRLRVSIESTFSFQLKRNNSIFSISVYLLTAVLIRGLISLIPLVLYSRDVDREKRREFECGFDAISLTNLRLRIRFYVIIILFLVFDIEICLLFPVVLSGRRLRIESLFLMLGILVVGVVVEWDRGGLGWKFFSCSLYKILNLHLRV